MRSARADVASVPASVAIRERCQTTRGTRAPKPNGVNFIAGTTQIYVGDVNAARIVDSTTDSVAKSIGIGGNSGYRADEGCYYPDHKIFMISSPGETPPFATFIDTTSQKIIATVVFTDPGTGVNGPPSAGLEACDYDHASQSFYVNNDGSTANPRGELDAIPVSAIQAGTPTNPVPLTLPATAGTPGNPWKVFGLGNCDPTGSLSSRASTSRYRAGKGTRASR